MTTRRQNPKAIQADPGSTTEAVAGSTGEPHLMAGDRGTSTEQLERLFDLSQDMLGIANTDGFFKRVNPSFERILGYSSAKMLTTPFIELVHPDDVDSTLKEVEKLSAGEPTIYFENRYRTADGTFKWIAWTSGPDPETGDLFAVGRDITHVKQLEERLTVTAEQAEEANRVKSEFLANMSHELRTPLNSIIGFSEILAEKTFGDLGEKQSRYVNNVLSSGRHLLGLINDILDLSKIESGHMELFVSPVDIGNVVRDAVDTVRPLSDGKNIGITIDLDEAVPLVEADEPKLRQVMLNLLSNAIKFTPADGSVDVRVGTEIDQAEGSDQAEILRVSVSDTGHGVDPVDHERLFNAFEQLDGSFARTQEGTGLGLALTRRLVEMHSGRIWIESEGADKGSTFFFEIPLNQVQTANERKPAMNVGGSNSAASVPNPSPGGSTILVIDDERSARELIAHHLTTAGYRVVAAGTGEDALEKAREFSPVAITLDVMMPGKDGWAVLSELKSDSRTSSIPVVIVSITEERQLGLSIGATDCLVKPVKKSRLVGVIRAAIGQPKTAGSTILVVDDDRKAVKMLGDSLRPKGYRVLEAFGGKDGIDQCVLARPDAVILDLMMPEVSGLDVLRSIRRNVETAGTPVIVLTAKDLTAQEIKELNALVQAIAAKPAGFGLLIEELNRLGVLPDVAAARTA